MRTILLCLFLTLAAPLRALTVTQVPEIDFGTVLFSLSGAGTKTIYVTGNGAVSLSGSGGIVSQSGGAAGTAVFTKTLITELVLVLRVTNTSTTYSANTSGCGQATLSGLEINGGLLNVTLNILGSTVQANAGGKLTLNSVVGSNCVISGVASGALRYGTVVDLDPAGPVDVKFKVRIGGSVLTLNHDSQAALNFGTLCQNVSASQTLTVAPDGTASSQNLVCGPGAVTADSFTVNGLNQSSFSVTLPASVTLQNGAGNTLSVSALTSSCGASCTITSSNEKKFTVGGTLTVPPSAAAGSYAGTYPVTVVY